MVIKTNVLVAFVCLLFFVSPPAPAQVTSTFDTDIDGWWTVGDPGSAPTPAWSSTGGNPGGCIKGTDVSIGTWFFYGPSKFRGDLSAYYGCNLTFDLKQSETDFPIDNTYDVMIIKTNDSSIVYNTAYNPGTTWTSYTIPLSESSGWRRESITGTPVTSADEIRGYLSNVKKIRIRAEFSGLSYETDFMDNVEIGCTTAVLPLSLTAFSGYDAGNGEARLTWSTASETDLLGFQVEKSFYGNGFDSIGFIQANGTTVDLHAYTFTDPSFSGDAYYRLKEISSITTHATYSDIIFLESNAKEAEIPVRVYPNPATSQLLVTNTDGSNPIIQMSISDLSGKTVFLEEETQNNTATNLSIDTRSLPQGLYILRITRQHGTVMQKIEILH